MGDLFDLLVDGGVLHAEEETTEEHVGVLGVALDLEGVHHEVHEAGFELAEGARAVGRTLGYHLHPRVAEVSDF